MRVVLQDDTWEHQGAHVFLPGGNLRLLQGLARGIPIMYSSPARLVQYSAKGVSHGPVSVCERMTVAVLGRHVCVLPTHGTSQHRQLTGGRSRLRFGWQHGSIAPACQGLQKQLYMAC